MNQTRILFLSVLLLMPGLLAAEQIVIQAHLPHNPSCQFLLAPSQASDRDFEVYVKKLSGTSRTKLILTFLSLGRHNHNLGRAYDRDKIGIANFNEDAGFILRNAIEDIESDYPPIDTDWRSFRATITPQQRAIFAQALKVLRDPSLGRLIILDYSVSMRDPGLMQGQNLAVIWPEGSETATIVGRWISSPTHDYLANIFSDSGQPYFLLTTARINVK